MLEKGIIRKSTSSYASRVILAKKKDGTQRFCVDYRRLNENMLEEQFHLPRPDDLISQTREASFFVALDCLSGFCQLPLSEQHKHFTAFIVPERLYEFNVSPFEAANAPSAFQRTMVEVLEGLLGKRVVSYIDDILIFGFSFEECLERLSAVLSRCIEFAITLKLSKCEFFKTISKEG